MTTGTYAFTSVAKWGLISCWLNSGMFSDQFKVILLRGAFSLCNLYPIFIFFFCVGVLVRYSVFRRWIWKHRKHLNWMNIIHFLDIGLFISSVFFKVFWPMFVKTSRKRTGITHYVDSGAYDPTEPATVHEMWIHVDIYLEWLEG
jgi:hypothetical protein